MTRKVIQTIYDASVPIPGPAIDINAQRFLREVRLMVHEAIRKGEGKLVSDALGRPDAAAVDMPSDPA